MPPLDLYQLGGWVLFAFSAFSLFVAIVRGDFVTGAAHRREIMRGDRLEAEGIRLARHARRLERDNDKLRSAARARKAAARRVAP